MTATATTSDDTLASARETFESIWIAIVMAFVLRAFVVEAFVIPTGSMAPRLMGQHWQFDCPACGYHYAFGIASSAGQPNVPLGEPLSGPTPTCPMCLYKYNFGSAYGFSGDRVLVLKYLYQFRQPKPWDVVVFKNPTDNEVNYIKRLIGLPGQQIQIVHGDIFFRDGKDFNGDGVIDEKDFDDPRAKTECPWQVLRKQPATQQVMWQMIYDNDYQPDPARFEPSQPWVQPWALSAGWTRTQADRVLEYDGKQPARLAFTNDRDRFLPNYPYNQRVEGRDYNGNADLTYDLQISTVYVPKSGSSKISLQTSSFEDCYEAVVSADGTLTIRAGRLDSNRQPDFSDKPLAEAKITALEVGKAYELALQNVDHSLSLWIDGKRMLEGPEIPGQQIYDELTRRMKTEPRLPTPVVGIEAGGGPCELRHLRLAGDVFYTSRGASRESHAVDQPFVLRKFLNNPDLDEFFVLGDNSPNSLDARWWDSHAPTLRPGYRNGTVPRYNMIGKAFFVYWPGGYRLPFAPSLPLVPNVGRMRLIR